MFGLLQAELAFAVVLEFAVGGVFGLLQAELALVSVRLNIVLPPHEHISNTRLSILRIAHILSLVGLKDSCSRAFHNPCYMSKVTFGVVDLFLLDDKFFRQCALLSQSA